MAKGIAGTAVGIGSVALLGSAISNFPKWGERGKDSTKRLIKGGVTLLVGIPLLGAASKSASAL